MKKKKIIKTLALALGILSLPIVSGGSINILNSTGIVMTAHAEDSVYMTGTVKTSSGYEAEYSDGSNVAASGSTTINGIPFTLLENGDAYITPGKWGSSASYTGSEIDIIIPETIQYEGISYKVKGIGSYAFYEYTAMQSIKLPDSIELIETCAFNSCTNLSKINIPSQLRTITNAFSGIGITSISIPSSITSISYGAFNDCLKLSEITFEDRGENNNLYVDLNRIFSGCTLLKDFRFPDNTIFNTRVTNPSGTFYGCKSLVNMDLSNTRVSDDAANKFVESMFARCTNLESLKLPNNMLTLGNSFFGTFGRDVKFNYIEIDNDITPYPNLKLYDMIIKSTKTTVDNISGRPRVYFYDADGVECITAFSVPTNTNIAPYAAEIGTKWTRVSGSLLGVITEDSVYTLSGELVKNEGQKLESPILNLSTVKSQNRTNVTMTLS